MRDASDDEENSRPKQDYDRPPRRQQDRPRAEQRPMGRPDPRSQHRRPMQQRNSPDDRIGAGLKEIRREGSSAQSRLNRARPDEAPPRHSAQSRLDRGKPAQAKPKRADVDSERSPDPWQCPDPSCNMQNPAHTSQCRQCKLAWYSAQSLLSTARKDDFRHEERPVPPRFRQQPPPKEEWSAPRQPSNNWQAMPPNQEPSWTQPDSVVIGHWQQPPPPEQSTSQPDPWMANSWREGSGESSVLLYSQNPFIWVSQNISALVGCIKKLRALYEVQLLETFKIPQLNLTLTGTRKKLQRPKLKKSQTAP